MANNDESVSEFEEWAHTDRQREVLHAWEACNRNYTEASKKLKLSRSSVRVIIRRIKERAARQGYCPEAGVTQGVPPGYKMRGSSRLYDKDGNIVLTWVKDAIDNDSQREILMGAFEGLASEVPRLPLIKRDAGRVDKKLINFYPITDVHLGMLSWKRETGDDWDLNIGIETVFKGFQNMVENAPPAHTCVIGQMGDYLHSDSLLPVTPTHHHVLDQDTRYPKLARKAVELLRMVVELALKKHQQVELIIAEGNHDMVSSVWLQIMFEALYENQKRLRVDNTVAPYYVTSHGDVMLAIHHGHMKGIQGKSGSDLALIFADTPEWAKTKHRFIHTGHKHAAEELEVTGAHLIQHPTIAARDAYATRGGWKHMRRMVAHTYHMDHGEHSRVTISPEMF